MEEKRQLLISQLEDYRMRHPSESPIIDRFVDFVSSNVDCCERSNLEGHLTGSAWLVNRDGTHVLLTHHRRFNKWLQLGGHADGNQDLLEVATKEAYEESGLGRLRPLSKAIFDLDIHRIPASGGVPEHDHYDVRYAFEAVGDESYRVSDESNDLRWVEIANIADYAEGPTMLRMAEKWKNC